MKLIWCLLISLYEFSIFNGAIGVPGRFPLPPESVIIKRLSQVDGKFHTFATLKKLPDQSLANENLPVWIAHGQGSYTLERLSNVMDDIGPFLMYQDADVCTAAVFFYKGQQFTGNIEDEIVMENVHYDRQTKQLILRNRNIRPSRMPTHAQRTVIGDGIYERELQEEDSLKWKYVASRLPYPETVYIEVMVMINYDLAVKFQHDYAALVSYTLVQFNNVDMLYSRASNPKIKINIAGIVIAEERASFPELVQQNCYQLYDGVHEGLDMTCVLREMKNTIYNFEEEIPPQSYDVAIFLSHNDIFGPAYNAKNERITALLTGESKKPDDETYNGYRSSPDHLRVAVVYVPDEPHQCFMIIAHELAHLFNVYHDNGNFKNDDGECTANAMRLDGGFCTDCMYFSDQSLQQMTRFFGSRDACIFRNKPNSLIPPQSRPKVLFTDDEQCRCYGYDESNILKFRWTLEGRVWTKSVVRCGQELRCARYDNGQRIVEGTTYIMNGTPCGMAANHRVCWNARCTNRVN